MFCFFDLECSQTKLFKGRVDCREHVPNLCVRRQSCDDCMESDAEYCDTCGTRNAIYRGESAISDFISYLLHDRKSLDVFVISHNMRSYDGQFILRALVDSGRTPQVIMQGSKILSIELGKNIKFIDSLSFLPTSLASLPAAFNLTDRLAKSAFPHLMNKVSYYNYDGPMPPIHYYSPENMSREAYPTFLKWYNDRVAENYNFVFKDEFEKYCINDVLILQQATLKFRESFMQTNGVDPLTQAITISSACMKVFQTNHLKENTIGIAPVGGYRCADRASHVAKQWLDWEAHVRGVDITHAGNGREGVFGGYKLDGVYTDVATGVVHLLDFHGCIYHGCDVCYPNQEVIIKGTKETMGERHERTMRKKARLESLGFDYTIKWECEFKEERKSTPAIDRFLKEHPRFYTEPLSLRDAFYGGRTNCTTLYHKVDKNAGERILYYDVISLYPWLNRTSKYPKSHPVIYDEDRCKKLVGLPPNVNINCFEGIIKCSVAPPTNLWLPVLPQKVNGKLVFSLCRTCAQDMIQTDCPHNESERQLTGVWVVDEVRKAVELGYKITRVFEIYKYEIEQYDPVTKQGGLFTSYINTFLQQKVLASGYPKWVKNDEDKAKYIQDYRDHEGIDLDPEQIVYEPIRRFLGKIQITSFWGKLCQRENLTKCTFVKSYGQLVDFLTDPSRTISKCVPINDDIMLVNWTSVEECTKPNSTTSVACAAYTTAMGRLKLYELLECHAENLLYFDTDGYIIKHKPGDYLPPTGDYLGQLTNELEAYGPEAYISHFVSGGPKSYAYVVETGDGKSVTVCKCRGISQTYGNTELINFEALKAMVVENAPANIIPYKNQIVRKDYFHVVSVDTSKVYRPVITKRRREGEYNTLPFGFIKS
jgi:DNA polymerase type B, organellar and viral